MIYQGLKNDRGITLVALVITVIVLIVLAAVSISSFVGNDNAISGAKNAKEEYVLAAKKDENTIDDLIKTYMTNGGSGPTAPSPMLKLSLAEGETTGTLTVDAPEGSTVEWISSDTSKATISGSGTSVTINAVGNGRTTITAKVNNVNVATWDVVVGAADLVLKKGDYIYYNEDNTGNAEKWVVFYDESDGYGIQIASSGPRTGITLSGLDGYNNNMSLLSAKCADYAKGLGTRSYRAAGTHPLYESVGDTVGWINDTFIPANTVKGRNSDTTDFERFQELISKCDFSQKQTFTVAGRVTTVKDGVAYLGLTVLDVTQNPPTDILVLYTMYEDGTTPVSANTAGYENVWPIVTMQDGIYIVSGDGSSGSPYQYAY